MNWEREINGADVLKNVFTKNWIDVNEQEKKLLNKLLFATMNNKVENMKKFCWYVHKKIDD